MGASEGAPKAAAKTNSKASNGTVAVTKPSTDMKRATDSYQDVRYALNRSVTDLLFFISVGNLRRVKEIVEYERLNLGSDRLHDYDMRTPLHLGAANGSFAIVEYLLQNGASRVINVLDTNNNTPLDEAIKNNHADVALLLYEAGGLVYDNGVLVNLQADGGEPLGKTSGNAALGAVSEDEPAVSNGEGSYQGAYQAVKALQLLKRNVQNDWEIPYDALEIQELIGAGAFGEVYKARWRGTQVAVKKLSKITEEFLKDFETEIAIVQKLHHPNVVQYLGFCDHKGEKSLVSEYLTGGSLADLFSAQKRRGEPLALRRVCSLARDAACGLAYLHNRSPQPVIHRDLKPSNLLIDGRSGVLKLVDFGLSKTLSVRHKHAQQTLNDQYELTGETGSYRYMAPEVFRHEKYNQTIDCYAFAMILFQLYHNVTPFATLSPVEAARAAAIRNSRPVMESSAPTWLKDLLTKLWNPIPKDRISFEVVVTILEREQAKLTKETSDPYAAPPGSAGKSAPQCQCIIC
mmetsp:Transcript_7721/g.28469  ORF Transcript_7721/g.28469 Transcript_7721/m.28469 type:complete len:518 (-) Transcript_7721:208-1761(-)